MYSSLLTEMGRISGLRVISETTSRQYKDANMSIYEIASELNVDAVMEAEVLCLGDDVCFNLRMISAYPEEEQLLSADYRKEKSHILELYNQVVKEITDAVKIELTSDEERLLAESKTVDPDAYELYLKGKFHMGFLTRESQEAALDYFNKALEIDPEYAPAYAGIAGIWAVLKQMDYVSPDEANPKLEESMSKAIQLDSQSEEVYFYDAIKKVWTDFDWKGGEEAFKHCLEINPNFSEARAYYSHLLMLLKRRDEMKEQMNLALKNDPKNSLIQVLEKVELMIESEYDLCMERSTQLQLMMPKNTEMRISGKP
jgi:tetratricopeptide (TPR) repeat protein